MDDIEHFVEVYEAGVRQMHKRIEKLEAERRWIPVEERLPDENVEVITWDGVEIISDRYIEMEDGSMRFSLPGTGAPVTHWMPLPPPPEVADE